MTFVEVFSILVAVVGPPKILLAWLVDTENMDSRQRWRVAFSSTALAAATGLFVIVAGRLLLNIFHISGGALTLASGVILFIHALNLVLGRNSHDAEDGPNELATAYIANPVAVAYLFLMADSSTLPSIFALAGGFLAVIALDLVSIALLGIMIRFIRTTYAWVLVRILGVLLAALGVDLIVTGLEQLGVLSPLAGS